MRVAIVEDSEIDRLNLKTLLADHEDVEIAGEADTLERAVELIDGAQPDAVFLDIHLGRQKGFKALEQARHRPLVVITTSHPHYALQGYEIEAVDYLLKPVLEEALARALERLRARFKAGGGAAARRLEMTDMQMFKEADGMHLVSVGQIQAIVGERIYTRVLAREGRTFLSNRPLREWRKILPDSFKTLDRSTIVNIREILKVHEEAGESAGKTVFRGSAHTLSLGEVALKTLRETFS